MYYDELEDLKPIIFKSKNYDVPKGIHIMNKNEKTALRKLKKETGLSEEEIRKEKKFRVILSNAQKLKGRKNDYDRLVIYLVREVTKTHKLPLHHPEFKNKLKENIERRKLWTSNCHSLHVYTPDHIISQYLSIRKKNKQKNLVGKK